jgi:hypothetical protein
VRALFNTSDCVQKRNTGTTVYINNPDAVVVPAFKFNKEIAEDFLQIAVGTSFNSTTSYDHIRADNDLMIVYRIRKNWKDILQRNFNHASFRHTYTKTIEASMAYGTTGESLFVQFYHHQFILCAMQQERLMLIQTFEFETPADVSYHLLNACNQLGFTGQDIALNISGMIDLNSTLYHELHKYFENMHTDTIDVASLSEQIDDHPPHYFTPFFKLAL